MKKIASPERSRGGFTIIEMMIAVAILGIITTVGSNLFFTVLRGSTKAKVLQSVKQNGGYSLSVMQGMIRNARKLSYAASPTDTLTITNPDGGTTTFHCCGTTPNYLIASESGSLTCEQARLTSDEVKVNSCANFFTVTPGLAGVRPDLVAIQFTLSQAGVSTRPEEQAAIDFQATVGLRNY